MHKTSTFFDVELRILRWGKTTMFVGALVLMSLFFSQGLHSQTEMASDEAAALRKKVKHLAGSTKTIISDFVQYKHLDFLSNDIQSEGKLAFKAPDLIKWEYTEPFRYAAIFKNNTLYINNEGKKNNVDLSSNKVFEQMNKLMTKSIRGDMFDTHEFAISYYKLNGEAEVHFAPKNEVVSQLIKTFQIVFNDEGQVMTVKMMEPSGDFTKIVFSNRTLNKPLPDAVFSH